MTGDVKLTVMERNSRLAQLLRHRLFGQIINIRRDGLDFGWIEHAAPAVHSRVGHALGDHGDHLVGTIAVLPFLVGEVAHGRTDQVGGQRAVATAVIAVAGIATRQKDLRDLASGARPWQLRQEAAPQAC